MLWHKNRNAVDKKGVKCSEVFNTLLVDEGIVFLVVFMLEKFKYARLMPDLLLPNGKNTPQEPPQVLGEE